MNTALVKRELLESLRDPEFREAFNGEHVYTTICFQIRALREQRDKSQKELGALVQPPMAAERISILEDPNSDTKPTVSTLLRLANALGVGLDIRFVPYGTVLDRSVHTDTKELEVPAFEEELPRLELEIERELSAAQAVRSHRVTTQGRWELLQGGKRNEPTRELRQATPSKKPITSVNPYELVRA